MSLCLAASSPTGLFTLSLHDALPIWAGVLACPWGFVDSSRNACTSRPRHRLSRLGIASLRTKSSGFHSPPSFQPHQIGRHTSELQSPCNLVCRLLLEKKKKPPNTTPQ